MEFVFSLQKFLMIVIKGLCTGSSSLTKVDILSYAAVLKQAISPACIKDKEAGTIHIHTVTHLHMNLQTTPKSQPLLQKPGTINDVQYTNML